MLFSFLTGSSVNICQPTGELRTKHQAYKICFKAVEKSSRKFVMWPASVTIALMSRPIKVTNVFVCATIRRSHIAQFPSHVAIESTRHFLRSGPLKLIPSVHR